MNRHSEIQNQLYDYATNALRDDDRGVVERHLLSCKRCVEDLKNLESIIALLLQSATTPSDEKDESFWLHLAMNVEKEIRQKNQPKPNWMSKFVEHVRSFFMLRPSYSFAIGGSLAAVVVAFFIFRAQPRQHTEIADASPTPVDSSIVLAQFRVQERISQYFRKSRTLLVGIANLKTHDETNLDLSTEKNKARSLIREARFVKMQPINNRTERLVNDLERILIELANLEAENDLPNVELIRSGITQENLLFKIRMAEASFDTSRSATQEKIY